MKFEIDFNTENDDKTLELIGGKLVSTNSTKYPPFEKYEIEINSFEELDSILKIIDESKNGLYSAIVSFDPPTIYLDKDV